MKEFLQVINDVIRLFCTRVGLLPTKNKDNSVEVRLIKMVTSIQQ